MQDLPSFCRGEGVQREKERRRGKRERVQKDVDPKSGSGCVIEIDLRNIYGIDRHPTKEISN